MEALARELLLEIARCPVFVGCKTGEKISPACQSIVAVQSDVPLGEHHLPEAWSGHLERAPILFVSSNPAISRVEAYPTWDWGDEQIVDFFDNRFAGGKKRWVVDGKKSLRLNGSYSGAVAFWSGVQARAKELLGRPAAPGSDYALVEVVRCKSAHEHGVKEARSLCSERFLRRTIEISGATVIVALGDKARLTCESMFGGPPDSGVHGPVRIGGRERYLASLGHPTSANPKRWENCVGTEQMLLLRAAIKRAQAAERL